MLKFWKREPKEVLDCLGYFETKPYHYFASNMVYSKAIPIIDTTEIKVYTRFHFGTILIYTFVENEKDFDKAQYSYEALKDKVDAVITEPHKSVVNFLIFKNKNEATMKIAKEVVICTKTEYNQTFVFDSKTSRLKYYRPVPNFYKLYDHYLDAVLYDLGAVLKEKR